MRWIVASIALTLLSASSCATSGPVPEPGCEWVGPIWLHQDDALTGRTLDAIIKHNEAWEAVCNG